MLVAPSSLYEKNGDTAVLLLHAYSGSPNDLRMLARFLERANYSVYAPLFSGHGTSNPEDILAVPPEKWYNEAQDALHFLQAAGFAKIYIFGLSMGGIFATHLLAQNAPGVGGGGIFSSPITKTQHNTISASFKTYAEQVLARFEADDTKRHQRLQTVTAQLPTQLAAIERFAVAAYNALPQIVTPYFIAQAGRDDMIDGANVLETIQLRITNDLPVTFHWYERSGHVLTVGAQKNKLFADVLAFIEACEVK